MISEVYESGALKASYYWLTDGTKAGVQDGSGDHGYEYLGSLVYERTPDGLRLESAAFGDGRIQVAHGSSGETYTPHYFLTDHLGSTRAIVDPLGQVSARSNYYAFGLRWSEDSEMTTNRYLYNGKESQSSLNVNYLDYGARMYNPRIGRWNEVDPLSNYFESVSPYSFSKNNPLRFVDHDGMQVSDTLQTQNIEPVIVTAAITANQAAYYMLPMFSLADDADRAWNNGQYWRWAGNMALGTFDGLLFFATLGRSATITGPWKVSAKSSKLLWGLWSDYAKTTYKGKEYAKIGNRLYTRHAVDRMAPKGLGEAAGGAANHSKGFGISSAIVEDVINNGAKMTKVENGATRTVHNLNGIQVVTEDGGKIVVSIYQIK